jgi:uncharacterized protein YndB with AHSA1/START domain
MQDVITREIIVTADKKRVYAAITDPAQIIKWFPDALEGTLEVGQRTTFIFTKQDHKAQVFVEKAVPFEYFSYRWVPGTANTIAGDVLEVPNTLVEFFIEELNEGTKVTVKESGFASFPSEVAEESLKQNSGGWEFMIGRLEKIMNQG